MCMNPSPPPLPTTTKPIQFAHFEASKSGFMTPRLDRTRLDAARLQAQCWMNQNPELEIISVDSSFGNCLAIVTVWYR